MEIVSNPSATAESNVAALETTVLEALLPTLFPGEGCTRRVLRSRRLAATGASILPPDAILACECTTD